MSQPLAQLERDAAIARIGRARRWMIVAATALTAAFAAIISAVAPGRSFASHSTSAATSGARRVASTSTSTSSPRSRSSTKLPPLEGPGALGLGGPAQAPQASTAGGSSSQAQAAPSQSQVSPAQSQAASPAQSSPPVVSGGS